MSQYSQKNNGSAYIDSSKLITGLSVEIKGNSDRDFDRAFRQFNKKCHTEGLVKKVRERQYYTKPAEQKQIDRKAARSRHLKELHAEKTRHDRLY
jgi:ribosomal protein S21